MKAAPLSDRLYSAHQSTRWSKTVAGGRKPGATQPMPFQLFQSVGGKKRSGAVTQQPLQALPIMCADENRCVQGEKSAGSGFSRQPSGKGASPKDGTSKMDMLIERSTKAMD